jgi:hypothetical protein
MNPSDINPQYVTKNRNPPNNENMFTNIQNGANIGTNLETILHRKIITSNDLA